MARLKRIKTIREKDNGDYLVIFQGDGYLKGEVRNIRFPKKAVMSAYFYEKDGDASEYKVRKHFDF